MRWPFELPPSQEVVVEEEEDAEALADEEDQEDAPWQHEVDRAAIPPAPEPELQASRGESPLLEVDPNQVREEIRRDALKKQANLAELQALKAEALRREQHEAAQRHARQQEQLRRTVELERLTFRHELRGILKRQGGNSAPEISALQQRYVRPITPETARVMNQLRAAGSRINRHTRIQLYRRQGLPEAMILEELAHEMERGLDQVLGVRAQDEALIRAARILLITPIPASSDSPLGAFRAPVGRSG